MSGTITLYRKFKSEYLSGQDEGAIARRARDAEIAVLERAGVFDLFDHWNVRGTLIGTGGKEIDRFIGDYDAGDMAAVLRTQRLDYEIYFYADSDA